MTLELADVERLGLTGARLAYLRAVLALLRPLRGLLQRFQHLLLKVAPSDGPPLPASYQRPAARTERQFQAVPRACVATNGPPVVKECSEPGAGLSRQAVDHAVNLAPKLSATGTAPAGRIDGAEVGLSSLAGGTTKTRHGIASEPRW